VRVGVLTVVAAVVLAGCGGSSHHLARNGAPPLAATCGRLPAGLKAQTFFVKTSDGVRIYLAAAGTGKTAVALIHESGAGLCGWLPTMQWLSTHGIRAVGIELRGYPPSDSPRLAIYHRYAPDIQAAVDAAHTLGSKDVFVLGASLGGAATVAEAPKLKHVDGLISLSGELQLPLSELDAIGAAPHITLPFLLVASENDPYLDGPSAHRLYRAVASTHKQVAVFPGSYHGWDLLDVAPYRTQVKALILGWIMRQLR
jgi:alpha-beta hydrolase superfamily lysophospholipase